MSVGRMLAELLGQADVSKNTIIRRTGIDRSTFYQILRGTRVPTEEQLQKICYFIHADEAYYTQLIDCYEQERAGEKAEQRKCVRAFIEALSKEDCEPDEKAEGIFSRFVNREKEAGNARVDMFLPSNSVCTTKLYRAIKEQGIAKEEAELHQIIAEDDGKTETVEESFRRLGEWITYLRSQRAKFHAYRMPVSMAGLRTNAFPFYIVGEKTLIVVSLDEKKMVVSTNPSVVKAYRENFKDVLREATEVASTESNTENVRNFLLQLWQNAGEDNVYLLTPKPRMWLYADDELISRYMEDPFYVQYGQAYRGLNIQEFTLQSGIDSFCRDGLTVASGEEIRLAETDMSFIRNMIDRHRDSKLLILDENRIHLSQNWRLFLVGTRAAVFVPYATNEYMICITSSSVVEPLAEWFSSRTSTLNNDVIWKKKPTWGGVQLNGKMMFLLTNSASGCDNHFSMRE